VEDVEYRPQRRVGITNLLTACLLTATFAVVLSTAPQSRAALYTAPFPAAIAMAWLAAYVVKRRLRTRLTLTGIESRRLRTRVIPWAEIRDVEVVRRFQVASIAVLGNRTAGRYTTRSGRGNRKVAWVRVRQANGRWRQLAMPVVWEYAPDPDFTTKAEVIKDRWRAATGQVTAADAAG
jgi:hypothetical protein